MHGTLVTVAAVYPQWYCIAVASEESEYLFLRKLGCSILIGPGIFTWHYLSIIQKISFWTKHNKASHNRNISVTHNVPCFQNVRSVLASDERKLDWSCISDPSPVHVRSCGYALVASITMFLSEIYFLKIMCGSLTVHHYNYWNKCCHTFMISDLFSSMNVFSLFNISVNCQLLSSALTLTKPAASTSC